MLDSARPFYKVFLSATGLTVALQIFGLVRQSITASLFGFGRDLDLFWTVYAMAAISVFAINVVIETSFTAMLIKVQETEGELAFRQSLWSYAASSVLVGVLVAVCFLVLSPFLGLLFSAGFSSAEYQRLVNLACWSVPWIGLLVPYYGLSAIVKSARSYNWAFTCELLVVAVTITSLVIWHDAISHLPIAYAFGYLIAVLTLAFRVSQLGRRGGSITKFPWNQLLKRAISHYSAIQTTSFVTLAERYWMSFLPAGGIAAIGLVQQLQMGLSAGLSLRESYLVPLSMEAGREDRIRRLVIGMTLMATVVAAFVAVTSREIVELLFEYGRVSANDVTLLSSLLTIAAMSLFPASVCVPIWRTLQLVGRHRPFVLSILFSAVSTVALGFILVGVLRLDAPAIVGIAAINSYAGMFFAYRAAGALGLKLQKLDWYVVGFVCAAAISIAVSAIQFARYLRFDTVEALLVTGGLFFGAIAVMAYLARNYLRTLIRG